MMKRTGGGPPTMMVGEYSYPQESGNASTVILEGIGYNPTAQLINLASCRMALE